MRRSKYPKKPVTLGQKIRKKRMDLGRYLLDVAKEVGITESYLSRIEADKQIPLFDVAKQLEKALGVSAGEFTAYTDNFLKTPEYLPALKRSIVGLKQLIDTADDDNQIKQYSPKDKKVIIDSWKETLTRMTAEYKLFKSLEKNTNSQKSSKV